MASVYQLGSVPYPLCSIDRPATERSCPIFRYPKIIGILFGLILVMAGQVIADETGTGKKLLSECRSFWMLEIGGMYPFSLDSVNNREHDKWHEYLLYTAEVGLLYNRFNRFAFGGTIFFDYDDFVHSGQMGTRIRARLWLTPKIGLDLAPGIILSGSHSEGMRFSGTVTVNAAEILAFALRLDVLEPGHRSGEDRVLFVGVMLRTSLGRP